MPDTQQPFQRVSSLEIPKHSWERCLDTATRGPSNDEKLLSLVHATEWSLIRRWEELRAGGPDLAEIACWISKFLNLGGPTLADDALTWNSGRTKKAFSDRGTTAFLSEVHALQIRFYRQEASGTVCIMSWAQNLTR